MSRKRLSEEREVANIKKNKSDLDALTAAKLAEVREEEERDDEKEKRKRKEENWRKASTVSLSRLPHFCHPPLPTSGTMAINWRMAIYCRDPGRLHVPQWGADAG